MKTANYHFKKWVEDWNDNILNYDQIEAYRNIEHKCKKAEKTIINLLNISDKKAMYGKNEIEGAKALIENQNKAFYKDLSEVRNTLVYLECEIERMFELNKRKTMEIFELRKRIAEKQ